MVAFDNFLIEFYKSQKGIYLFLDLNDEQVEELRNKYGIYLIKNGRANITSINSKNIDYFAESINNLLNK